jgi:hypothetical protein
MATIVLIVIGVIFLLVKQNKLMREVFCWLAAGREHSMFFFSPKKARNEPWEVVGATWSRRIYFSFFGNMVQHLSFSLYFLEVALVAKNGIVEAT